MKKILLLVFVVFLGGSFSFANSKTLNEKLKDVKEKQQNLEDRLYELEYENASKEEKAEMDRIEKEKLDMLNKEIERMKKLGYTLDEEEVLKDDKDGTIIRRKAPTYNDREVDIFEAQTKARKNKK